MQHCSRAWSGKREVKAFNSTESVHQTQGLRSTKILRIELLDCYSNRSTGKTSRDASIHLGKSKGGIIQGSAEETVVHGT